MNQEASRTRQEWQTSSPRPLLPLRPRQVFYVLEETPCPYLPGRRERKLLTEIAGPDADARYSLLSRAGFRRSHHFAYRPACSGCNACVPVRVVAERFRPSRSLQRIERLNRALFVAERSPVASVEQYRLFRSYVDSRHGGGEMAGMSFAEYRGMVEQSHLSSALIEFRDGDKGLVAACLTDWLADGASAVYSFFDPGLARHGLGNFMVLWLIRAAQRRGLDHVYLGYWIGDCRKMAYKARFQPLECLGPDGWRPLAVGRREGVS